MQLKEKKKSEKGMIHFINRLRFEVRCSEEEEAFRLRQSFARTLQPEIVEIIDSVCSGYSSESEWLRLNTLEVDLGRFSKNQLDRDFAVVFREQFEKALAKQLEAYTPEERLTSKDRSFMELFAHYMLHGTLPWWSDEADMDIDAVIGQIHQHLPLQLPGFFKEHRENRAVWARAAFQLNEASKQLIISFFSVLRDAESQLLLWAAKNKSESVQFTEPPGFIAAFRSALLRRAPELINTPVKASTGAQIFDALVKETFPDRSARLSEIPSAFFFDAASASDMPGMHAEELPSVFPVASVRGAGQEVKDMAENRNGILLQDDSQSAIEQRYIVRHCGVILLAPFFKPFFTACTLLDGSIWKDKAAQYQAAHLLGYLSSGSVQSPEYSMVLEKLICGIAIEEPIPLDTRLQRYQLDEAGDLLASVIEHWNVLKNTSVKGLRETFLKRDGIVRKKDDGWLLQVEQKTLDVLLESIPWGYSIVVMPWNDYCIHVEW
ncbi:MAG: hypothetical protein HGB23_06405 [Chlorobiaceae bacterium]|nr:hypothetical protein [Chlorobiaceae bacterium]